MVWSMPSKSNLSKSVCNEVLRKNVYVLKWALSKVVPQTPFRLFKGYKPGKGYMCVYGCPSKVRIYNWQEKKMDPGSISEYFIRYENRYKGYRFYCPTHITRIVDSTNA